MPIKLQREFFTELEKYNPKFDMEPQMSSVVKLTFRKKKAKLELSQFLIKLYYKTIVFKTIYDVAIKKQTQRLMEQNLEPKNKPSDTQSTNT